MEYPIRALKTLILAVMSMFIIGTFIIVYFGVLLSLLRFLYTYPANWLRYLG
jgi:hypothetical protein